MRCVQCEKEHDGAEKVCDGCVGDAIRLMGGCLGGEISAEMIYRIFDMGGCGVSPMEQFRMRAKDESR
jgi:hypothetical protein